jgi:RNA polymerase sigma factor (sigma-70 family)
VLPPQPPTAASAQVAAAIADAHRREWAFVLAATVRVTRDLDLAEECVQVAYARALENWNRSGIPASPGAWLTTVARRRALDLLRRRATLNRSLPLLLDDATGPEPDEEPPHEVADDRLRLIFTCCHPALATAAQVALTLRLVCGLSTAEVARAFLVSEPTMAARITRAKKKIAAARIPYRVPAAEELPARVDAALSVVYLVFTTGHTAPAGERLVRSDLVERALDLARMLRSLLSSDREVTGLLALILLTDARSATRVSAAGELLLLADQDRSRWDRKAIAEGAVLVREALRRRPPGRFALMAAIAAVHAEAPSFAETPWREVVGLYDLLSEAWPSPVVALNRAAAIGLADGPADGLRALDALAADPQLATYRYLAAARADFLRQLGRVPEARSAYEEALLLSENAVERAFLSGRLAELDAPPPTPR